MESIITKMFKELKINYGIHLFILIIILIFNLVLNTQIIWLKDIYTKIYLLASYIFLINIILPIISLRYVCKNKITKKNVNIFKILTLIFCTIAIIYGFFFSGLLMVNAIETPEFCKECPFNLPINEIEFFPQNDLNKKCNERRCIKNSINPENITEKNENDMYEYICNYNPTSEFEKVKETQDVENTDNNTITQTSDNIFCVELTQEDVMTNSELENNYVINFYDKCKSFTNLYICERSKIPNVFDLKDNFVCPENSYITKLVIYCMVNILINLIFSFFPWKMEYNKYKELIMQYSPRRVITRSNSFSSTINDTKIIKENIEEDNFEHTPTQTIIVYGKNNSVISSINNTSNNNINNIIVKKNNKKLNFSNIGESTNNKNEKNKTDIKITKNINIINNININNKDISFEKNETEGEMDKENNKSRNTNNAKRITIAYVDNTSPAEKINLPGKKQ